jgi:O-antigen/teichoic acid export membrane protein
MRRSEDELRAFIKSLYQKLFIASLLPIVILVFLSEWAFRIVFGVEWTQSGVFASFLCLGAIFNTSYGPLSVLYRLKNKERTNFVINTSFILLKFAGLWIGAYHNSIVLSVIGYSVACLLSNMLSLFVLFRLMRLSIDILLRDSILVAILVTIIIMLKA